MTDPTLICRIRRALRSLIRPTKLTARGAIDLFRNETWWVLSMLHP